VYPREFFETYWRPDLRDEVFVAMPFHDEFSPIWDRALKPAIEEDISPTLRANRVDASTLSGSIIIDILDGVANSRVVFADISICGGEIWKGQRNGNVLYEVGLAHALRQVSEVVLVRSDEKPINFDLAGINIHRYDKEDLTSARILFKTLIRSSLEQTDRTKSLKVEFALDKLPTFAEIALLVEMGGWHEPIAESLKSSAVNRGGYDYLLGEGILRNSVDGNTELTNFGQAVLNALRSRKLEGQKQSE